MQSLPQKLEASIASLVIAAGVSVPISRQGETTDTELQVFTGLDGDEKVLPSVTVVAISGDEFPQDSGNFRMTVGVEVRTNADETSLTAHRAACENALLPLMQDDTAAQLGSEDEQLGVFGIYNRASSERVEDRTWVTVLTFDVYCCGQVLT